MRAWAAALLLAAAPAGRTATAGETVTARETVRLGYFTEAQPFEVACARGWFEGDLDVEVVCLPQSAGVGAVSKIDDGDLEISLLGSTPAAAAIARGVKLKNYFIAHLKGESQALLVRPEIVSPADLQGMTIGTPFGSTAHFYSTYIPVVSGVEFTHGSRTEGGHAATWHQRRRPEPPPRRQAGRPRLGARRGRRCCPRRCLCCC